MYKKIKKLLVKYSDYVPDQVIKALFKLLKLKHR